MSNMSDFEQRYPVPDGSHFDAELNIYVPDEPMTNPWEAIHQQNRNWAVWQAAKQSMQGEAKLSDSFISEVIQNVAELPDRNSPDDWPEAMLVTSDELKTILLAVHEDVPAVTHAPDSAARIAEQDAEIARLTKELEEARKDAEKKMFSHDAFRGALEAAAKLVEECEGLFSGDGIVAQNRNALKLAKAIRQIGGAE